MIPTIQGVFTKEEFMKRYEKVLAYEHLSQDLTPLAYSEGCTEALYKGSVKLEQLHELVKDPFHNPVNAVLNDCEPAVLHDLIQIQGTCAILDVSTRSNGLDYTKLERVRFGCLW